MDLSLSGIVTPGAVVFWVVAVSAMGVAVLRRPKPYLLTALGFMFIFMYNIILRHHHVALKEDRMTSEEYSSIYDGTSDDLWSEDLSNNQKEHDVLYFNALASVAENGTVIMALVSYGHLDLAYNFIITSILKHKISNVLFVSLDIETCQDMMTSQFAADVSCFVYTQDPDAHEASQSSSPNFRRKTHIRASIVLKALEFGFTILSTDVDIIFFKNPLRRLEEVCIESDCDIAVQWDGSDHNSGFVYIKPSSGSLMLYSMMIILANETNSDQQVLNIAESELEADPDVRFSSVTLDTDEFPHGKRYFHSCYPQENTYIVHNNWVMGTALKKVRFRDCLLWEYDGKDKYYTDRNRQYIMYTANLGLADMHERLLNIFLLGALLQRTVILPHFYKSRDMPNASYPSWILGKIYLDFEGLEKLLNSSAYRESNFLQNPLVPAEVKSSQSKIYQLASENEANNKNAVVIRARPKEKTLRISNILSSLGKDTSSVLRLAPSSAAKLNPDSYLSLLGENLVKFLSNLYYDPNDTSKQRKIRYKFVKTHP